MKKLVNKMKNKDRETIFIFSSDNGAVQIFAWGQTLWLWILKSFD